MDRSERIATDGNSRKPTAWTWGLPTGEDTSWDWDHLETIPSLVPPVTHLKPLNCGRASTPGLGRIPPDVILHSKVPISRSMVGWEDRVYPAKR